MNFWLWQISGLFSQENVKVGQAYYSYSPLSLMAEVGGHVGLFLGCAIIQVSQLPHLLVKLYYFITPPINQARGLV